MPLSQYVSSTVHEPRLLRWVIYVVGDPAYSLRNLMSTCILSLGSTGEYRSPLKPVVCAFACGLVIVSYASPIRLSEKYSETNLTQKQVVQSREYGPRAHVAVTYLNIRSLTTTIQGGLMF